MIWTSQGLGFLISSLLGFIRIGEPALFQKKRDIMSKVVELSEALYERLLVVAHQRHCTPEELIDTWLARDEQAQYYQANQQMMRQGILTSIPSTPTASEAAFTPVEIPGPPLSRTILDDRR